MKLKYETSNGCHLSGTAPSACYEYIDYSATSEVVTADYNVIDICGTLKNENDCDYLNNEIFIQSIELSGKIPESGFINPTIAVGAGNDGTSTISLDKKNIQTFTALFACKLPNGALINTKSITSKVCGYGTGGVTATFSGGDASKSISAGGDINLDANKFLTPTISALSDTECGTATFSSFVVMESSFDTNDMIIYGDRIGPSNMNTVKEYKFKFRYIGTKGLSVDYPESGYTLSVVAADPCLNNVIT